MTPIRCHCGKLRGEVRDFVLENYGICHCADCQAFAHELGAQDRVLDEFGGTAINQIRPSGVSFTEGSEHLACLRLSPKGTVRWYASCCNTPIGNTPANKKAAFLGLIHACWADAHTTLPKPRWSIQRKHARPGAPADYGLRPAIFRSAMMIAGERISGRWKHNPLFDDAGAPIREPRVLSLERRRELMREVGDPRLAD